jgi:hypothetical protein
MDQPTDFSPLDGGNLKIYICVFSGAFFLEVTKLVVEWSHSTLVVAIAASSAVLGGTVRSLVSVLSVPEEQLWSESLDRVTTNDEDNCCWKTGI